MPHFTYLLTYKNVRLLPFTENTDVRLVLVMACNRAQQQQDRHRTMHKVKIYVKLQGTLLYFRGNKKANILRHLNHTTYLCSNDMATKFHQVLSISYRSNIESYFITNVAFNYMPTSLYM